MLSVIILSVFMQSVMVKFDAEYSIMVPKVLFNAFSINKHFTYYVYLNDTFLKLKM